MNFKEQIEANFEKATKIITDQQAEILELKAEVGKLKNPTKDKEATAPTEQELETAFKGIRI